MTGLVLFGVIAGLLVGLASRSDKAGCVVLMLAPVVVVACTAVEQLIFPERIAAFSGLDFVSDPFWFTLGALCGLIAGRLLRVLLRQR
jgi:hypothetical protein